MEKNMYIHACIHGVHKVPISIFQKRFKNYEKPSNACLIILGGYFFKRIRESAFSQEKKIRRKPKNN